jgi:hypothetical protein
MENVLVKKLGIVDTLGCVSTIASDKVSQSLVGSHACALIGG